MWISFLHLRSYAAPEYSVKRPVCPLRLGRRLTNITRNFSVSRKRAKKMPIPEKDTYKFQRARIERISQEMAPGKTVEFDEAVTVIKFRIRDTAAGINLTEPSGVWFPDELADKSDDWLRKFIKQLGNGKI
jgi:hypothetical protein